MKLLTVTVPCYNSASYMSHCIDTLLCGGDEVEIIIVDDGSSDKTAEIADKYALDNPNIVKVIHQENKGHGGALMAGLGQAQGRYFKVVDSDDWVDTDALQKILSVLRSFCNKNENVDMLISNYIYDKVGATSKKVISYPKVLPQGKIFTWDDIGKFRIGKYILMHSVIYRTEVLIKSGLDLPLHTFYVDNLFVYIPLVDVHTMYYLDLDFYHYFIGRDDQSVHEEVMLRRIDQQIKVNKLMVEKVNLLEIENSKKQDYMYRYLEIITAVSSILLIKSGTAENAAKKDELWNYIKNTNPTIYRRLRHGLIGTGLNMPDKFSRKIKIAVYKICQSKYGFN